MLRMCASNSHSYTHLILALGIIREPTIWGFITSKYPGTHDIGRAITMIDSRPAGIARWLRAAHVGVNTRHGHSWTRDRGLQPPIGIEACAPWRRSAGTFERRNRTEQAPPRVWAVRIIATCWRAWAGDIDRTALEAKRVTRCHACQPRVRDLSCTHIVVSLEGRRRRRKVSSHDEATHVAPWQRRC